MKIAIEIQGLTSLLCSRFIDPTETRRLRDCGTPREIAASGLYMSGSPPVPVIPHHHVLGCLIDAASERLPEVRSRTMSSCIQINGGEAIPLIHQQPWKVDTATAGPHQRHRPRFDDWALAFTVELETTIMSPNLLRMIFDDAGVIAGLGDWRPARGRGNHGRFAVVRWQENVDPNLQAA